MTARQVASLALKLTGVVMILNLLSQAPYIVVFLAQMGISGLFDLRALFTVVSYASMAGAFVILCGYIFFKSDQLALLMVDDEHDLVLAPRVNIQDIHAIAFSIVGVVILAHAIRMVPNVIAAFMYAKLSPSRHFLEIASLIFETALGLGLFFQARGLARLWQTLRS